jgi:hypothetical protein
MSENVHLIRPSLFQRSMLANPFANLDYTCHYGLAPVQVMVRQMPDPDFSWRIQVTVWGTAPLTIEGQWDIGTTYLSRKHAQDAVNALAATDPARDPIVTQAYCTYTSPAQLEMMLGTYFDSENVYV